MKIDRRMALGALTLGGVGLAQAGDADQAWQNFLDWAAKLPPEAYTRPDLIERYAKVQVGSGMSQSDADALIGLLKNRLGNPKDLTAILYDRTYRSKSPTYSTEPSSFLASSIAGVVPGTALDLGTGDGRNAIFLAGKGWKVTGLDLSEGGLTIARARAAKLGLAIDVRKQDVDLFDFGTNRWDLVIVLYFSGYPYVKNIERRITDSLRPNGLVVIEGPSLNPVVPLGLWTAWVPMGLKPLHLEFHVGKAEWGQAAYSRVLAQKSV